MIVALRYRSHLAHRAVSRRREIHLAALMIQGRWRVRFAAVKKATKLVQRAGRGMMGRKVVAHRRAVKIERARVQAAAAGLGEPTAGDGGTGRFGIVLSSTVGDDATGSAQRRSRCPGL